MNIKFPQLDPSSLELKIATDAANLAAQETRNTEVLQSVDEYLNPTESQQDEPEPEL